MYISEILEITNYRNLTGKRIKFNETLNFLIGENNIGKTNMLELINIFLSVGKFIESDFTDVMRPIRIRLRIKYSDEEVGYFEDNFDVDDSRSITLLAVQDSVDERINYYHDTPIQTKISIATIRRMNVLYYYAQRMPLKEVDFRKTSGSGKVLNYFIQYSLKKSGVQEKDILKKTKLNSIVKDVNKQIKNLNTITGDNVSAYIDTEADKLVQRDLKKCLLAIKRRQHEIYQQDAKKYIFESMYKLLEILFAESKKVEGTSKDKYEYIDFTLENKGLKHMMEFIDEQIVLTTIHAAKGLEWEYVIIPKLNGFAFPNSYMCNSCQDTGSCNRGFDYCEFTYRQTMESKFKEEMSIFYVAITRAKKDVFFTVNTGVNKWNYVKTISCLLNLEGLTSEDYEWENVI